MTRIKSGACSPLTAISWILHYFSVTDQSLTISILGTVIPAAPVGDGQRTASPRWLPWVTSMGDVQKICELGRFWENCEPEKSGITPGEQTWKRKVLFKVSEGILLSAAGKPPHRSVYDEKTKGTLPWKIHSTSSHSAQVTGTLSTCQEENHSDWGHKCCVSKESSPSALSGLSSLKHHYFQQPYKNSAKR